MSSRFPTTRGAIGLLGSNNEISRRYPRKAVRLLTGEENEGVKEMLSLSDAARLSGVSERRVSWYRSRGYLNGYPYSQEDVCRIVTLENCRAAGIPPVETAGLIAIWRGGT